MGPLFRGRLGVYIAYSEVRARVRVSLCLLGSHQRLMRPRKKDARELPTSLNFALFFFFLSFTNVWAFSQNITRVCFEGEGKIETVRTGQLVVTKKKLLTG